MARARARWKRTAIVGWGLLLALAGCASGTTPGEANPTTAPPTSTATPTAQPSPTPSPTWTPLPPTLTPLPTLSPEEAQAYVIELLETNGDCELPCWWGIIPGETEWISTQRYLATFTEGIHLLGVNDEGVNSIEIDFGETRPFSHLFISVIDNIVLDIRFDPSRHAEINQLHLDRFLSLYGKPSDVFMYVFRPSSDPGDEYFYPFRLILHYPEQKIIAYYGLKGQLDEDVIYWCAPADIVPELFLWSAPSSMKAIRVLRRFVHGKYVDDMTLSLPILDDFTNMSVDDFYQTFSDPESDGCIETPELSWIGPLKP